MGGNRRAHGGDRPFNVLAFRRSGKTLKLAESVYARTEERYQADRLEARDDM
jgi:hypothetical protein